MIKSLIPRIAILVALLTAPPAHAEDSLAGRLRPLIDAHKGRVVLAVRHLGTGEGFAFDPDKPMPTASLIKFPVMVETYRQANDGKVDLAKALTLTKADQVPGSGILRELSPGLTLTLRDAVRLMIALSDNTATNLVLDQIGLKSTAETMERMGCPNTKIHSKVFRGDTTVFPERSKEFGLGSTTANEMLHLLEALNRKELVSKEASEAMLEHLKACDDPLKFPRFLPDSVTVAMKTGSVSDCRTAAGILFTPKGAIAVVVLTDKNEDQRWNDQNAGDRLCADVAREVFLYFNPPAQAK